MREGSSFRTALGWAFAMSWGQRVLGAAFTFVLAALVGPRSFGIVAMALILIGLALVFLEQGIGTAIVQRENLEPEHLDSAFWLNTGWSILLAFATIAVSGLWATLNDVPELQKVTIALSPTLVFLGLIVVQQARLQRQFDMKRLAVCANVATLGGGVVGVALALSDAGLWALVGQQLATDFTLCVLLFALSGWRPRLRYSRAHGRDILGYSSSVLVANLGGFLNRRSDALLLGLFFGPAVVGVYRLADRIVDTLLELTMRPVGLVSLPAFSRLQNDPAGLRASVGTCIRITLIGTVPALLVLAGCSPWVLGLLGSEWVVGATALKLLCIVGIAKALVFFTGPLLFAVDRPRLRAIMLWLLAAISALTVVVVGSALQGSSEEGQLVGMSAARAVVFTAVIVPLNLYIVRRLTGLGWREMLRWSLVPLAAGGAALALGVGLDRAGVLEGLGRVPAVLVAGAAASGVALAVLLLDLGVRRELGKALGAVRARGPVEPRET